jgi:hypothetical protein
MNALLLVEGLTVHLTACNGAFAKASVACPLQAIDHTPLSTLCSLITTSEDAKRLPFYLTPAVLAEFSAKVSFKYAHSSREPTEVVFRACISSTYS